MITKEELLGKIKEGKSISEFAKQELEEVGIKMDYTLMLFIKRYAEKFRIPLWLCIQNILISDFARKTARMMVEGPNPHRELPEFVKNVFEDESKEVKTGEELFNYLVEVYKEEYAKRSL